MARWFSGSSDYRSLEKTNNPDSSQSMAELQRLGADFGDGLGDLGNNLRGMIQDSLDIGSLKEAGFGARGMQLLSYRKDAFNALSGLSAGMRSKCLLALREMVKDAMLSDPDMPRFIRSKMENAIEQVWNDLTLYEEKMVHDSQKNLFGRAAIDHDGLSKMGRAPMILSPMWFRAKVLYTLFPFDKSIWGQLKNPLWWLLLLISVVPNLGIRIIFWLIVLFWILRGCPPDEYQLVSFILMFKGTQVISSGVVMSTIAALKYYMCVHPLEYHSCATQGPGVRDYLGTSGVDFIGSCLIVWFAFLCLPFSKTSAGFRSLGEDENASGSDDEPSFCGCARLFRWDPSRGGRLTPLLCWDMFSFALSIALFFFLIYVDVHHLRPDGEPAEFRNYTVHNWRDLGPLLQQDLGTWNVRVAVFWTRVFYAWLSFPFLVFKIPVVTNILTHTTPTGYNTRGTCVPFMLRPMPVPKEE